MHRFVRAAAVGLIAGTFTLAGCSGSSGAGATAAAGASSVAGASSGPAASVAPTGGATATCKQLQFADVQPLLDAPITNVEVTAAGLSGGGQECRFEAADPSVNVDVTVVGGDDGTTQYNSDISEFDHPAPLPGVGDKAMWDSNDESAGFAAIKGNEYCSVGVEAEDVPGVGALMDAADNTNQIGDANYLIIATALATVCNRIYGSGNTTVDLSGLAPGPSVSPAL
ncbi:MAG TPA: hypothetical protein VKR24_09565 [Candidatus Limnocylindrales bacterium]|nr:hypothetical protein [Candidatus Limnocylindrales bacterium]